MHVVHVRAEDLGARKMPTDASVRFCELSGRKPVGQVSLVPPIEFRQQIAVARLTHSASNFYFVLIHFNHPVSGEFGERR